MSKSDEFDGPSLNTDMWVSGPLWYARTGLGWPFRPENAFVQDGNLHLRAMPGNPITAAAVHSKFLVRPNSYVEVRAKLLPWAARLLSAIWMSHGTDPGSDPSVEIDIQEIFNPTRITSNLHLWSNGRHIADGVGNAVNVGVDVTADYHVYGFERRSPDILRFYFDGRLVWDAKPSRPTLYASQERWLVFSLESHLGQPNIANLPADALIDYARVYTLGSTTDGGRGGMDGSATGGGGSTASGGRSGAGGGAGGRGGAGGTPTGDAGGAPTGGAGGGAGGMDAGLAGGGGSMASGGQSGTGGGAGGGAPTGGAGDGAGGGTQGSEGGATGAAGSQASTSGRGGAGGATSPTGGSSSGITANQTSSGCSCRLGDGSVRGKELGLAMALLLALSRLARRRRGGDPSEAPKASA